MLSDSANYTVLLVVRVYAIWQCDKRILGLALGIFSVSLFKGVLKLGTG